MKTRFPHEGRIDFGKYLDAYLQRDDAVRAVPTEVEVKELARKAIVREQLTLVPLPEGEAAQEGDTAVLKTVSEIPKFNKERATVTLGRGLYSRELENALTGCKAGDSVALTVQEKPVLATILELKRKQAPAPTDEMVEAMQAKDNQNRPIHTVAEYEAYIREEKTNVVLTTVNFYTMEEILKDYPISEFDEEDIRVLGELERETFIRLFREQDGIDLTEQVPDSWEEMGVHTLEEFIASRREWYQIKIRQCLVFLNILDLPCQGETDPLDHYEVLSELQMQMFEKIRTELERRNAQ